MKRELKAVIDTNVIVGAVIGKSATLRTIYNGFIDNLFTPVLCPLLQEEIGNVIRKPAIKKYFRAAEIKKFRELINIDTIVVTPSRKISLCRDPKDNILLETAVEANADFIVTGDKDLLVLKFLFGIPIITPRRFSEILKKP